MRSKQAVHPYGSSPPAERAALRYLSSTPRDRVPAPAPVMNISSETLSSTAPRLSAPCECVCALIKPGISIWSSADSTLAIFGYVEAGTVDCEDATFLDQQILRCGLSGQAEDQASTNDGTAPVHGPNSRRIGVGISKRSPIVADGGRRYQLFSARYMRHLRTKPVRKLWAPMTINGQIGPGDAALSPAICYSFGRGLETGLEHAHGMSLARHRFGRLRRLGFDARRQKRRCPSAA